MILPFANINCSVYRKVNAAAELFACCLSAGPFSEAVGGAESIVYHFAGLDLVVLVSENTTC
jgi:hypothetical protein